MYLPGSYIKTYVSTSDATFFSSSMTTHTFGASLEGPTDLSIWLHLWLRYITATQLSYTGRSVGNKDILGRVWSFPILSLKGLHTDHSPQAVKCSYTSAVFLYKEACVRLRSPSF